MQTHNRITWTLLAAAFTLLAPNVASAQSPEFRAMWVSRFEWPDADETTCKNTIDTIVQDLAGANFNAVFCQVRGQADVLYPSPYEVWSPLIGGTDPGWDPLAYAIEAAHTNGLEFHAYINTHTCWQSDPPSAHTLPDDPNHLFYAHCNASDPDARDWLHHVAPDSPVQFSESEYVWLAPGVPDYQAYIRQQVLYVVENYDVDGVHFDRIRTPWSGEPSYDPISLARFNDPQSNPGNLDITEWTADQITRNVRDIYAAIMAVKPHVKVSAAVYSNPSTAPTNQHQDAIAWAQDGAMDILVPMMYFSGGAGSTWDTRLQLWLAGCDGRHVVAGHITSQGLSSLLEQIALTRTRGAQGNSVFSWSSFSWWTDYTTNVYQTAVSVPAMTWKDTPTKGIIYGYVTDAFDEPVVDARVVRSGSTYRDLSTGDGFYSMLLVNPGSYTLTATHPGYTPAVGAGIPVSAGEVKRIDIHMGMPLAPVIAEVTPDPEEIDVGEGYTQQLTLTQGIAESWSLLEGPPGAEVSQLGYVSGWAPSAADAGVTFDFTVRAVNTTGLDEESWQVHVQACEVFQLTDFEGYANGAQVLFESPRYSGTTRDDLETSPDVAEVTDAVTAFSGTKCYKVEWQYIDTDPQRWMRLTTYYADNVPNPTVTLDRPIRVRLRVDAGRFRLAMGIRETNTSAGIGEDGGTSGAIEWVGAASDSNGAPHGIYLVEPDPGVWQTFTFDPLTDPVHALTGDGILSTATNKGVFEHLAFSVVDTVGPMTVYIDDVDLLCDVTIYGDLDIDGDVDLDDFGLFKSCLEGPGVFVSSECLPADANADTDVDLHDFAAFQQAYTGPQ